MRGPKRGEGEGKLRENEECRIEGGGERPVRERLGCGAMAVRVERLACTVAAPSFFPRRGGGRYERASDGSSRSRSDPMAGVPLAPAGVGSSAGAPAVLRAISGKLMACPGHTSAQAWQRVHSLKVVPSSGWRGLMPTSHTSAQRPQVAPWEVSRHFASSMGFLRLNSIS